jgi:hypothetical protein
MMYFTNVSPDFLVMCLTTNHPMDFMDFHFLCAVFMDSCLWIQC